MDDRKFLLKKDIRRPTDARVMSSMLPIKLIDVPPEFSLYKEPIRDQDGVGLCFAFATARSFGVTFRGQTSQETVFSPQFIGTVTRNMEGSLDQDNGATLGDSFECLEKYGVVPDSEMPFDPARIFTMPSDTIMTDALKFQSLNRFRLPINVMLIKQTIVSGYAPSFGTDVYESFMKVGPDGKLPVPKTQTEEFLGRHALVWTAYDDTIQNLDGSLGAMLVTNSWGPGWGNQTAGLEGTCWMPYTYVMKPGMLSDLQVVSKTEIGQ